LGRPGQSLERSALQCVAEASLLGIAPATNGYVRRAWSSYLAELLRPGDPQTLIDVERFARPPSEPTIGAEPSQRSAGALTFFGFLESRLERRRTGVLATSLLTRGLTETPAGAARWEAEPDLLDILQATTEGPEAPTGYAALWEDFGLWRRALTPPDATWRQDLWTAQRPAPDLVFPLESLPRRALTPHALMPTGQVALWIPFGTTTPLPEALGMRLTCEQPASYCWTLSRTDAQGKLLGRIPIAFEPGQTQWERSVTLQAGDQGLMLVGTNLGGVDSRHPFDPDIAPYEPHACVLYVAPLTAH